MSIWIIGFLVVLLGVGGGGVPKVVKTSSHELVVAHEKYGKENERFLETVKASLWDHVNLQLSALKNDRADALEQVKQDKIDDFLPGLQKKNGLGKDAAGPVTQKDLDELTKLIEERQRELHYWIFGVVSV